MTKVLWQERTWTRRILTRRGRVPRRCVILSLMIAVAVILAGSSFFGSGQAGAYYVETTSWTTITSFTTTSSTIETGIEIQTITIIGVVVVAALATVAALSRLVRKPSLTLPTKPASQLPGGSEGRFFHEGYSEDTPSPEEAGWHLPGGRKILHAIDHPEGGAEGGGSGLSGWKEAPRGEGAGRGREGGTPEGSSRMGGSETDGPASSEGGGDPVRSAWGGRGVVQRSGGSGSGVSDWRGTLRGGGGGGGSASQGGSEVGGHSQEASGSVSSPPEGGSEVKAPSSEVSTPGRSSQPFTPYQVAAAGPAIPVPSSDESTTESAPTTSAIEPTERTTDSASEAPEPPSKSTEDRTSPTSVPMTPPSMITPPVPPPELRPTDQGDDHPELNMKCSKCGEDVQMILKWWIRESDESYSCQCTCPVCGEEQKVLIQKGTPWWRRWLERLSEEEPIDPNRPTIVAGDRG